MSSDNSNDSSIDECKYYETEKLVQLASNHETRLFLLNTQPNDPQNQELTDPPVLFSKHVVP